MILSRLWHTVTLHLMFAVSILHAETAPAERLPDPLTLSYALSLADDAHPQLLLIDADIKRAQADLDVTAAEDDWNAYLEARARYVEPSERAPDRSHDDHQLGLVAEKELYDFGHQRAQLNAAQATIQSRRYIYLDARSQRRLLILQHYFDVLLADLLFYRYNEEMAVKFIDWDRSRDRRKLGQRSDLEVLEKESEFQRVRVLRYQSQNQQRQTRARLAETLNRAGQLPSALARPDLSVLQRKLPEVEDLQQQALQSNYRLKALQARLEAAQQTIQAARNAYGPSLTGQIEAYENTRELISRDKFRAGVTLQVPIFSGGRDEAELAKARALLYELQARQQTLESDIRQSVLETWLELDTLRLQREERAVLRDYRELNLDQSRALYEMEVKADLGDAMVRVSEAEYLATQTDFKMALAWMRLDILTGQLQLPPQQE